MSTWKFAGTDLGSYGIVTRISDMFKLPERRNNNILIPFRDGTIFTQKYYDQRKLTLGMAITENSIGELETRMDSLRLLLGRRSQASLVEVMDNATERSAQAEVLGDLGVNRISPVSLKLAIDFLLSEPFFRSNVLMTNTTTINTTPKTYTITNPGTAEERKAIITLTGPLNYPRITNTTNGVWVGYNGVIGAGNTVVIDVGNFTALYGATNVIGSIVHSGDPHFLVLSPGVNSMSVTDLTHTTGTVKIEFYAPYY